MMGVSHAMLCYAISTPITASVYTVCSDVVKAEKYMCARAPLLGGVVPAKNARRIVLTPALCSPWGALAMRRMAHRRAEVRA